MTFFHCHVLSQLGQLYKLSYTEWLKQQHLFLTVPGAGRCKIWTPVDQVSGKSPVPSFRMLIFLPWTHRQRAERGHEPSHLLIGALILLQGLHPHDLITSWRLHLLIASHWESGSKMRPWGEHKHSAHHTYLGATESGSAHVSSMPT